MPNWITNILVCDNLEALDFILNKENNVDFETLIPMPNYIRNTAIIGREVVFQDSSIKDWEKASQSRRPLTREECLLGASQGWYDWSKMNWGCKWNASNTQILDPYVYSFQTAWSPPNQFLVALSKKFKNDIFYLYTRDEGREGGLETHILLSGNKIV